MANDDQSADPEERIAQLEAALRAERARNSELHERVQVLEGHQAKGSQGTGDPSWRRIVLVALIASVGPCLACAYPVEVFVDHEDPLPALYVALGFTLYLFVGMLIGMRWLANDHKELQKKPK